MNNKNLKTTTSRLAYFVLLSFFMLEGIGVLAQSAGLRANSSVQANPQKITISLTNLVHRYDGTAKHSVAVTDFSFESSDFIWTYSQNGRNVTPVNAGIYKVKATLSKMYNGQLYEGEVEAEMEIEPRPLNLVPDAKQKVYGELNPEFTFTLSENLIAGNQLTGKLACESVVVGDQLITRGNISAGENYILTVDETQLLTISPRPITLKAIDTSKIYGDSDAKLEVKIADGQLVFADQITGELLRAKGENVGTYQILQHTLTVNPNYQVTYVPGSFAIHKKPVTITVDNKQKVYGIPDPVLTYTLSAKLVAGDALTGKIIRTTGEDLGNYAIEQGSLTPGSNYDVKFISGVLSILKATVRVEAEKLIKKYGDKDPELIYKVSAPSASFTLKGALAREAGETVGRYLIQKGTLAVNEPQYELVFITNELVISPRPVTVSAYPQNKIYGNKDPQLTYVLSEEHKTMCWLRHKDAPKVDLSMHQNKPREEIE